MICFWLIQEEKKHLQEQQKYLKKKQKKLNRLRRSLHKLPKIMNNVSENLLHNSIWPLFSGRKDLKYFRSEKYIPTQC